MKTCVATVAVALCFVFVSHHQFCTNARFGVGWIANGRPGVQCGAAHSDGHFQEQSRSSEVMKPLVGKRLTDLFDFGFFLKARRNGTSEEVGGAVCQARGKKNINLPVGDACFLTRSLFLE